MKKRIVLAGITLILAMSLFGCSKNDSSLESTSLISSFGEETIEEFEIKDNAKGIANVAQSTVETVNLVSPIDNVENEVVLEETKEQEEIIPDEAYSIYYIGDKEEKILLNYLSDISMEIKKSSKKDIKVLITNNTDKEIIYGESFTLQQYIDNKWVEVPYVVDSIAFNAIGFVSNKENPSTWSVDFENFYGSLKKGTYRIIKDYTFINNDYKKYYLSAEFKVK